MSSILFAPFAEFFEFDFTLNLLLILSGIIVGSFAGLTG